MSQPTGHEASAEPTYRSVNDLIAGRLNGRLSRRELIQRARDLGLALPVIGVVLHATGDAAFGAPNTLQEEPSTRSASNRTKPPGAARTGGTIAAGAVGEIETFVPYLPNLYADLAFEVLSGVMDGLLAFDARQRLRPALAQSYEVSDDGLVYTFRLREGATFHNGDRLIPEDVIRTWRMIMHEDLPAWSRLGWEKIADITAPDDRTVVVTTSEIYAPFLSNIAAGAFNNGVICPKASLEKGRKRFVADFAEAPIGTGPMRFVGRDGDRIRLERFADSWRGKAKLDRVEIRVFPPGAEGHALQLEALRAGEIQVAGHVGAPSASLLNEALTIPGATVLEWPSTTWGHLDLKQVGFLRETKVRQALDLATPKQRIIDEVLGGRAIRAFADQAPGSWVYHTELKPRGYDLGRARELLDEVDLKPGADGVRERDDERFFVELWGEATDPQAPLILELIAESWTAAGVQAVVKLAPASTLWGPTGYQFSDRMTAGYYRWSNFNDPDNMFYWHSSQIPTSPTGPGGNLPAFFYEYNFQEKVDDLTSRAAAETDPEQRKALYWEIQELLRKEVPVIFLYWDKGFSAAASNVGGYWPSAFTYLQWNVDDWYLTEG